MKNPLPEPTQLAHPMANPSLQLPSAAGWRPWHGAVVALAGFGVWLCWSVITVQLLNAGSAYSITELFSLIAIAGMSGATLRLTMGFTALANGGRVLLLLSTALLVFPVVGIGYALQNNPPFWVWQLLAFTTGLGGGLLAVCLAQVGSFCPPKEQTLALGLITGVGHVGITVVQVLLPLGMTLAFWRFGGEPVVLASASGTLLGSLPAGSSLWIQNASYMLLFLLMLCTLVLMQVNKAQASPDTGSSPWSAMGRSSWALGLGFTTAAAGLWLMLPGASGLEVSKELVLILVVALTLIVLRRGTNSAQPLNQQPSSSAPSDTIFNNKHAWIVGLLGTMSLGSLLGFAAAFPLLIQAVFGYHHTLGEAAHSVANVNGPGALTYAWMGPLAGILARPLGGLVADRVGGPRVTQVCALLMASCAAGIAYYVTQAYQASQPELYFLPFLLLFLVLFAAAGAGHAAVLHTMQRVFPRGRITWMNVWIAASAAYGVFYIPQVLGEQLAQSSPERAMVHFALFYTVCLLLNGWFYLRKSKLRHSNRFANL